MTDFFYDAWRARQLAGPIKGNARPIRRPRPTTGDQTGTRWVAWLKPRRPDRKP